MVNIITARGVEDFINANWEIMRDSNGHIIKLIATKEMKTKIIDVIRNGDNQIKEILVTIKY